MKNLENISNDLFNKIRGRFPSVTIGDAEGNVTNVPEDARFFDFDYKDGNRVLGKVSISLDEESVAVMYTNDFVANEDSMTRDNWYNFLKELRQFSKKRLLNFDTRNITKNNLDKRDYQFLAQNRIEDGQMTESKLYGTSRVSYQDVGEARIMIKHTEGINQEQSAGRTKKIGKIYVESPDGERFIYPYKHLSGARAMARHVAEGGKPYDDFGKHITGLSEEMSKLRKFKTYMGRSAVMAESLAGYMDIVKERITTVKKTIECLQKSKTYKEAVDSFEAPVLEDVPSDVAENWIDQLTIKQFNEELQDVFPYIYNLVSEATKAEEIGPNDLNEGILDWIKSQWQEFQQARADRRAQYEQQLQMMTQIMQDNGMDDYSIRRIVDGCLNDPRVCMYNHIRKSGFGHQFHNELQDVYQELKSGFTTRSGTTDEEIESAFEDLMGQFGEGKSPHKKGTKKYKDHMAAMHAEDDTDEGNAYAHAVRKAKMDGKTKGDKVQGPDGDEITLEKEGKTPLGEFILSYFDYTTGQFPKGETAVLTMVEKDYGEQFIEPAKQFIEKINNRVAEVMGYKEEPEEVVQDNTELDSIRSLAGL